MLLIGWVAERAMEIRGSRELTALSLSFPSCKMRIIIVSKYIPEKEKLCMSLVCSMSLLDLVTIIVILKTCLETTDDL